MYWKKGSLNYELLIPPINKSFEQFTPQEAKDYFEWHINHLDERIEYLKKYSGIMLDYSVESLVWIWEWFLKIAEIEKTPVLRIKELQNFVKKRSKEIRQSIMEEHSKQFALQTEYVIRDIAMYFGEVYIRNNPSISWGYHTDTKEDSFANMPLLVGFEDRDFKPPFKVHFDISFMIRGVACNLFDGDQKKEDLLELYNKWQRMV